MRPSASTRAKSPGIDQRAAARVGDERLRGLGRIVVVPERDVAAAREETDRARTRFDGLEVLVEHDGVARGLHTRDAVLRRVALLHHPDPVHPGLARSDRVEHHRVLGQQPLKLFLHGLGEDRGGAREREQRRHVDLSLQPFERVGERARHRVAGHLHHVHAVLLDGAPHLLRLEACGHHRAVAFEQRAVHRELTGAVHERRQDDRDETLRLRSVDLVTRRLGRGHALVREHVDAATEREVHVLLAPHDTLRHAGGTAGVEDVHVVVGTLGEVALGRAGRDRGFELDRLERGVVGIGVVPFDPDEGLEARLRSRARRRRAVRTPAGRSTRRRRSCRTGIATPLPRSGS